MDIKLNIKKGLISMVFALCAVCTSAQDITQTDSIVQIRSDHYSILLYVNSGTIDYVFPNGTSFKNTTATYNDNKLGNFISSEFKIHKWVANKNQENIGENITVSFIHSDNQKPVRLTQYITLYKKEPFLLISLVAESKDQPTILSSNNISPLATTMLHKSSINVAGKEPFMLDMPYDNDNWTKAFTVDLNESKNAEGQGYEFTSMYDNADLSGIVVGNLSHNFWKTGIKYTTGNEKGYIDELIVYGGASTKDNPRLPKEFGGYDGTHDVVAHGSMKGRQIYSPLVFLSYAKYINDAYKKYGEMNTKVSGRLLWKNRAPFYWNSFGVEDVLGYRKIMMPSGVTKISDFIFSLKNFNDSRPILSIDSYDQSIYTTDVLSSIGSYAENRNQQMGFYFIPFAIWTWKNSIETAKLQYTDYLIRDVTLKDNDGKTIIYKDGEFGAFPLDPTHPATRERIIAELKKAKAINAKLLKIDFLSAGAMESSTRYDKRISTGLQGYNYGMKMLKHLIDSILGEEIFITQAISPMFPHQYAHARFLSTDVYSHLHDGVHGFPKHGSTASAMITSSHLGWTQNTLWPYTNMDVIVMKNFQNNPTLNSNEIKVRLYTLIVMGSILGDGSDFRDKLAAQRATQFLNNKNITEYFKQPQAFLPLKLPVGLQEDQQLLFYLPGKINLVSAFNFSEKDVYKLKLTREQLGLEQADYQIKDFMTDSTIGYWIKQKSFFEINIEAKDAVMYKIIPMRQ